MRWYQGAFPRIEQLLGRDLLTIAEEVAVPTWHAQDVRNVAQLRSWELMNVSFWCSMPDTPQAAVDLCEPQMPWAEDHFGERVSGEPLNPPPSAELWQTAGVADKHRTIKEYDAAEDEEVMKYSHTYPERFWCRFGAVGTAMKKSNSVAWEPMRGIRFNYGDLADVVDLLRREPLTRQAYLPVWFPEDTGAYHRERVPCSLGYHFMIRNNALHVTYMIRSVDFVRHFRDDVYLAMRLAQWMREEVHAPDLHIGNLTMHIMSLHYFAGDKDRMERSYGHLAQNEAD